MIVHSTTTVAAGTWYRARCVRAGTQVTVEVTPYGSTATPVSTTGSGATGSLSFASGRPASVGGKLLSTGDLVSSSDQLNGAVAQVWVAGAAAVPPVDLAPTSAFTSTTQSLTASFDGTGSSDPDGTVSGYARTFGDGSTGTGATAGHTYAAAGTYPVTLTVTDDAGATATSTGSVTVSGPAANAPPSASFTRTVLDLTGSFDATSSSDPDGRLTGYAWTFGDGSTGTGVTVGHTYAAAGTYPVTLTVTDDAGATATTSGTVTVTTPATTVHELASGASNAVATTYSTGVVTVPVTQTVVLAVTSGRTDGTAGAPASVTGLGTWTQIRSDRITSGNLRTTLYQADQVSASGPITLRFAGPQQDLTWSVLGAPLGSRVLQSSAGTTAAVTLAKTPAAGSATAGFLAINSTAQAVSGGTGYTTGVLRQATAPSVRSISEWRRPGTAKVDLTSTGTAAKLVIAIELG